MQRETQIRNLIGSQLAKNISRHRVRVGGMVGAGARGLEFGHVGKIIRGDAMSDASEELWEVLAVFEHNRRTWRLRRNVKLRNAIEAVFPQQPSYDRISCADGVCQTGEDIVSIDRKAAGVGLARCVANCRGNRRVV